MNDRTKRNLNIINDTIRTLDNFFQSFYQQLDEEALDKDTNQRIKTNLDDLKICLELYTRRLEREWSAGIAEEHSYPNTQTKSIALKSAVIIDIESKSVHMQGEDTTR